MKKQVQRGMCCPCGRTEILALGLCASCYSMKRQDEQYYGGLREAVLTRDGRRCRACPNLEHRKLAVHHRVPGVSKLDLMITLCTRCHAIIERTKVVLSEMTPLLLVLWREKHPEGKEQLHLPLNAVLPPPLERPRLAFAAKAEVTDPVDVSQTPAIDIVILIVGFDLSSVDEPLIKKSALNRLAKDRL